MLTRGVPVARLLGTEIRVHLSWTLIAAFLVASLGAVDLPGQNPGWPGSVSWAVAIAAGAGFFTSVLLHELAHLAVARRANASPASVTLLLFGGVSPAERGARTAAWEAAIAIAGPAAQAQFEGLDQIETLFQFLKARRVDVHFVGVTGDLRRDG